MVYRVGKGDQDLLRYHDPIPEKLRGQLWTSTHIDILWD
jgi:hypothetical protein